jgi:hypothetical protein
MPSIGTWISSMSDNLQNLYSSYLEFTSEMVEQYGAMEVAAIMMTQALSIYRTSLDEIDYNKMVDNISSSRNKVKKFIPDILQ